MGAPPLGERRACASALHRQLATLASIVTDSRAGCHETDSGQQQRRVGISPPHSLPWCTTGLGASGWRRQVSVRGAAPLGFTVGAAVEGAPHARAAAAKLAITSGEAADRAMRAPACRWCDVLACARGTPPLHGCAPCCCAPCIATGSCASVSGPRSHMHTSHTPWEAWCFPQC